MVSLKEELKTSCHWVEVYLSSNNINTKNMNLGKQFTVLYNINCNVLTITTSIVKTIAGMQLERDDSHNTVIIPLGVIDSLTPKVVMKDEHGVIYGMSFSFINGK
jgi:hypothetical protein